MEKECPVCEGTGSLENFGGCGDYECCGPPYYNCYECDGEGTITVEDEAA